MSISFENYLLSDIEPSFSQNLSAFLPKFEQIVHSSIRKKYASMQNYNSDEKSWKINVQEWSSTSM